MAYTTIDDPTIYFNTKLTTGTGSSQAVTGLGFQPDWVWGKRRDSTGNNSLFDSVRGITKGLESNSTGAEFTSTDYYSSFDSDGFTIAAGASGAGNGSSQTAVQWCWKAGTAFTNDASSTGIGSVDSTGSVNTDAGFSIINVVKNNTTAHTVAHGLGAVPQMIIGKSTTGGSYRWIVYHQAIGNTHAQYLNENFANTDSVTFWNDTSPTSSVFSLGTDNSWNGTNIFYCFAEKQGYSKFGSYTGNGSTDGTFVYTGFKPAWVMIKCTSTTESWDIKDNKRNPYNTCDNGLRANQNSADDINTTYHMIDYLSNGFKLRGANQNLVNGSGQSYIYMAFAENPFVSSSGVPATAR